MREFSDFDGAKVAILKGDRVVTILRDDRPDIVFPNMWDLPGGGRENGESAEACVLRELLEELSLTLLPTQLNWKRRYSEGRQGERVTWFFVAEVPDLDDGCMRLGNEGQAWRLIDVERFLRMDNAVPHLKSRLAEYLEIRKTAKG
ncbi:8-oxo-dGTP diphosphatase [Shimia isoporae]|uniref:8-oxo-dGTP diphosphatase n=1 Tax=Shimia isoporae TaxID=647720 RepID=A0A4R1NMU9_9RHOB|nr:NUDIX domain-containing protein [Shimia isoporae]TCL09747.1 8-oxo-dGTP diphosphatase [Shimia isoporae]